MLLTNIQDQTNIELECPNDVYYCAVAKLTLIMACMSDQFILRRLKRKSDISIGEFTGTFKTCGSLADIVTFSHDNETLAIASNNKIALVELKTGKTENMWIYCTTPADEENMGEFDYQEREYENFNFQKYLKIEKYRKLEKYRKIEKYRKFQKISKN